jgi:hypothetical protein
MSVWKKKGAAVASVALLITGAVGGWGISTTLVKNVAAAESLLEATGKSKLRLVGSYEVNGTDVEGRAYSGGSILDISLAPSGALEFNWDNGRIVGVGQLIDDNMLAVAYLMNGRTVISVMNINPDGSLSGKWLRRSDRGTKGTETWKKA